MARPMDPLLRDRILSAATRVFADVGFAGATMSGIGRAAGVTKGGVYFHFHGKEELFFAVLDHWRERRRAVLDGLELGAGGAADLQGLLREFLLFHFRYHQAASLLRVLATELSGRFTAQVREDLRGTQRMLRARIRTLLTTGTQDGSLFVDDPAFVAFLLVGALEGIVNQWLAAPRDTEPFCQADSLAEALIAPYATGAAVRPRPARQLAEGDFQPPF